jgi:hypothetical protein
VLTPIRPAEYARLKNSQRREGDMMKTTVLSLLLLAGTATADFPSIDKTSGKVQNTRYVDVTNHIGTIRLRTGDAIWIGVSYSTPGDAPVPVPSDPNNSSYMIEFLAGGQQNQQADRLTLGGVLREWLGGLPLYPGELRYSESDNRKIVSLYTPTAMWAWSLEGRGTLSGSDFAIYNDKYATAKGSDMIFGAVGKPLIDFFTYQLHWRNGGESAKLKPVYIRTDADLKTWPVRTAEDVPSDASIRSH